MDCEFFAIINDASYDKLSLPKKFADLLEGREPRELKVREVGIRRTSTWDMDVWFYGTGRMFLKRVWECFARTYGLQQFYFLICSYDGCDVLTVKMFDLSMCRVQYDATNNGSVKMELSDFEFYTTLKDAPSDKLVSFIDPRSALGAFVHWIWQI
ncbi:hypothetical protein QYE76_018791 [Lolium multiflorum]|uniref:TF-B3 domain-containing protein n=1 Tax=Lolium multiflorum TaxID=4521 RepID=A0AAD8Q4J0_LOLMU|nr:hypothetical protein QYE76_018791 [Lolium multiflorum]